MVLASSVEWLDTAGMAQQLGIHAKTLLRLRRQPYSPFRVGRHFRFGGLTTRAPLQWQPEATEAAFTSFRRMDPSVVEAFTREVA